MKLTQILETCLYVDDLHRAEKFYAEVLGLQIESHQDGRHVFFHCGDQMLLLFNPLVCREPSEQFPSHGSFGPGHMAFGVHEADLTQWMKRLEQHGVAIEKIIDWPRGGRSIYFRDPAGNSLDLATTKIGGLIEDSISQLLPPPYSLLPTPYSLLPTPYSLLPTPYSLLPMLLAFGEIMARIAPPGFLRWRQALPGAVQVTWGGGEANVCASVSIFGQ